MDLVVGYIRMMRKEMNVIVPNELINLMVQYCAIINVHFIMKKEREHYIIPLHDILQFCNQ